MIFEFSKAFLETGLIVSPGKHRIEACDQACPGLVAERRSTPGFVTVLYWRTKVNGKTRYTRLGTIRDLSLAQARKKVALLKAEAALAPKQEATPVEDKSAMTLDTFWTDHYYPYAMLHKRSYARDEQLYRIRIKPRFGHVPLSAIKRYEVEKFQADLLGEGLSHSSASHHAKLMRRFTSLAVQWDMLDKNVLRGIPLVLALVDNSVENYLDENQLKDLVEVLKVDTCRTPALALLFLVSTGARVTEALSATWKNIHVEAGVWKVDAIRAKGKRSRNIPLNESAKWVLGQLESKGKSEYLFPSPVIGDDGKETHYKRISRGFWSRVKRLANLPANLRIHDLRHSYLSLLAKMGASQSYLQAIAGHSDYRMTKRYIHLTQSSINEVANLASVIVPSSTTPTPLASPAGQEMVAEAVETAKVLPFPKAA